MSKEHPAFQHRNHRPWPLPQAKWRWRQTWRDLAFVHWEVDADVLRQHIPAPLELDLFQGKAWIGIVPFDMKGVTRRGFPAPPAICDFPEINVRTYVTHQNKPGVWFISLDVPNALPVWAARTFFHLPYFKAKMSCQLHNGHVHYTHQRKQLRFAAEYQAGEPLSCAQDSFEIWATERYCLYSVNRRGKVFIGEIHHRQWPLQSAKIHIHENTLLSDFPIGAQHPTVLFSKSIDVVVYPLRPI